MKFLSRINTRLTAFVAIPKVEKSIAYAESMRGNDNFGEASCQSVQSLRSVNHR
jgi:hypothetical protein